jgi:hypothetical protein
VGSSNSIGGNLRNFLIDEKTLVTVIEFLREAFNMKTAEPYVTALRSLQPVPQEKPRPRIVPQPEPEEIHVGIGYTEGQE